MFVTNIYKAGYSPQGNNLRVNKLASDGRFANMAEGDVADCGWAWGSQFADLNNDGALDLFVVNGFVSADPKADYWYDMARVASGVGDVIADAKNWAPMEGRSFSGYERSRVLLNDGQGAFTDVAEAVGVTDLLDGRAVAVADLFHRGASTSSSRTSATGSSFTTVIPIPRMIGCSWSSWPPRATGARSARR